MPEIYLYDEIGEGLAQRVVSQLENESGPVTVRINSPGGVVSEGLAIYNALLRYSGEVTVEIDGLAASIASLIAMAGNRVRIAEAGLLMVHAPWVATGGNAQELRQTADALDQNAQAMVGAYARKTGRDRDEILDLMNRETWLTADQAVEFGFADEIAEAPAMAASVRFDLTNFAHPPIEVFEMTAEQKKPEASASDEQIVARERERVSEINRMVRLAKLDASVADEHIRAGTSVENARAAIIDKLAEKETPVETHNHIRVGGGQAAEVADFRAAAVDGVLARYGVPVKDPHPASRDFLGMSVKELAQACLSRAGRTVQGSRTETILNAALTTSDFPALLENIAQKSVMTGFQEENAATHRVWTREGSLADFKKATRVAISEAPDLLELPEEGEIKHGSMDDAKESIQLDTFARIVAISRKAMINDDLDQLTRVPQAMGMAARRKEADLVYDLLTGNPAMRDGLTLFHADHGNLAGTGSAPSVDSLAAARAAMMKQKGLADRAYLNVRPAYVVCPVALESEFLQLLTTITPDQVANVVPSWIRELNVVADPRLDEVSESTWYLAAAPGVADTIEVARLDGEGPEMRQEESFETAGMRWRIIADIGVAALDWRGLYQNPGA